MRHGKVLKWSTGPQKTVQKEGGRVRKGPETRWACSVMSRTTKNSLPYYQAHTVYIQIDFCKCRFKEDTSETSFRSLCKMAFLATRTGHISSYSCPFDVVFSRIDSYKCPIQKMVSGFQYIFLPETLKMTGFCPKKALKNAQKGKKRAHKGPQKMLKRCQNDP